ncbi:hypothetical protein AGE08_23585 [Salmonella enterica subsp. enterica serovar Kentucky]|nr:hypothetical protein AGE08_23585 [Salmonella enterica subsp. enterica serovar Kentucky]
MQIKRQANQLMKQILMVILTIKRMSQVISRMLINSIHQQMNHYKMQLKIRLSSIKNIQLIIGDQLIFK